MNDEIKPDFADAMLGVIILMALLISLSVVFSVVHAIASSSNTCKTKGAKFLPITYILCKSLESINE